MRWGAVVSVLLFVAITAGGALFLFRGVPEPPPPAPPPPLPRVAVAAVLPEGQAAGLGIHPGDRIVSYGGEPVRSAIQLRRLVDGTEGKPGPIPVVLSRQEIVFKKERGTDIAQRTPREITVTAKGGLLGVRVTEDAVVDQSGEDEEAP